MTRQKPSARESQCGFTLIETLAALALTGLVLSALAILTAQWLPNWNCGFDRIQQSELIGISMQRIVADLAAAEFVPANRASKKPLFEGTALAVTFVRTALGPNVGSGLDVVRLSETTDQGRTRDGTIARAVCAAPVRCLFSDRANPCFRSGSAFAAATSHIVRLCWS